MEAGDVVYVESNFSNRRIEARAASRRSTNEAVGVEVLLLLYSSHIQDCLGRLVSQEEEMCSMVLSLSLGEGLCR